MRAKIENGVVVKQNYSLADLKKDNPGVSFPREMPLERWADYGVVVVRATLPPSHNTLTHTVTEGTPVFQNGEWVQTWTTTQRPIQEIISSKRAEIAAQYDAAVAPLEAAYSQKERDTWPQQVTEARAFQDNASANIPLVAALRASRGKSETSSELTAKIIANYTAFSDVVGTALGVMQARNQALALIDPDAEDAVDLILAV